MRFIGGIDPGLTGAIALLDFENFVLHLWDTPCDIVQMSGGTKRKKPNPQRLTACFTEYPWDYGMIEQVHSTPNDGHVGAFTFGKVTGMTIGAAAGCGIPLDEVNPSKWKHTMKVPAYKDASKARAGELFPHCAIMWARAGDHGRAEAAVIALYAAISKGAMPTQPFKPGLLNGEPPKPKGARK